MLIYVADSNAVETLQSLKQMRMSYFLRIKCKWQSKLNMLLLVCYLYGVDVYLYDIYDEFSPFFAKRITINLLALLQLNIQADSSRWFH